MMVRPISENVFLKPLRHSSLIFGALKVLLKTSGLQSFESSFYGQLLTWLLLKSAPNFLNLEQINQTEKKVDLII